MGSYICGKRSNYRGQIIKRKEKEERESIDTNRVTASGRQTERKRERERDE